MCCCSQVGNGQLDTLLMLYEPWSEYYKAIYPELHVLASGLRRITKVCMLAGSI